MSAEVAHQAIHRIAIVGVGALGCAVLRSLSGMADVFFTIIDGDRVETSNIGNQCLYSVADIGKAKVFAAATRLGRTGSGPLIDAQDAFLNASNAASLLMGHLVVIDCTDDLHAKDLIDHTCAALGISLVSGGVHGAQGQVVTLHMEGDGSSLRRTDLFGARAGVEQDGCDMRFVPLEVIEAVADRMVLLLNSILAGRSVVNGELAVYSGSSWTTFSTTVPA